jgi:hypothetical protein
VVRGLIEIERATVQLFTNHIDSPQPTAEFTQRLTQIDLWKSFVTKRGNEVEERLLPLLKRSSHNPMEFKYVLVVGRRAMLDNPRARDLFARKSDEETKVITHDSLISWFKTDPQKRRNILRLDKSHYSYKYLTCPCLYTFDLLDRYNLKLERQHRERLIRHGYEIDAWENGRKLNALGKTYDGVPAVELSEVKTLFDGLYNDPVGV